MRRLPDRLTYLRKLAERKTAVLESITAQGKLTPELERAIQTADKLQTVEDLYQPFKPKRRTRAMIARERGLEPLAQLILAQPLTRDSLAKLAGPFCRKPFRKLMQRGQAHATLSQKLFPMMLTCAARRARLRVNAVRSPVRLPMPKKIRAKRSPSITSSLFQLHVCARIKRLRSIVAKRAACCECGSMRPMRSSWHGSPKKYPPNPRSPLAGQLSLATRDGYERLLLPAIERDLRSALSDEASAHAVRVFGENVRALLLQPPIRGHAVIGIDPGFRTGCKIAAVDQTGKVLVTGAIYPHEPQKQWSESKATLRRLVETTGADLFAIGNGTASRETEQLVAEVIAEGAPAEYLMVSEAGASVYSASTLARAELPDLDVTLRGAVSIARRVIDPLAELVKIDARSIGVGLYQHDIDQKQLTDTLDGVVESAVNAVGVDANTASPALLRYVAGIGPKLAEAIVAHRDTQGPFPNRTALRRVKGLGPKAFEQAAGFLRVRESDEPLDRTAIHPEPYAVVRNLFTLMGVTGTERDLSTRLAKFRRRTTLAAIAGVLGCGEPTLADIFDQLLQSGRDPRDELPKPLLRRDVLKVEDLKSGMRLKGTA